MDQFQLDLPTFWFLVLAFFWVGYFVLEGFDFGVGMLLGVLGRDNTDRRVLINTIGPHWDGNEVWLVVAGAATFAAFPVWYATLFTLLLPPAPVIVIALVVRRSRSSTAASTPAPAGAPTGTGRSWSAACCPPCCGASRSPACSTASRSTATSSSPAPSRPRAAYTLLGGLTTLVAVPAQRLGLPWHETEDDLRERARALAARFAPVRRACS